ncbi:SDR family oxidoreductase [Nostoc sp.]|uniref:SDR family oxidoreductase n=1 Tax=Nostoc sp. TaxID=1180 RepID=UPI003FA5D2C9
MTTDENKENTQKVVLITGASSGIGEATARLLARQGLQVVLGARRIARLEAIASEIRDQGGVAEYRALDVTSLEDMQAFVKFAKDKFGRLDVLVNNAGLMPLSKLEVLKVDEWNRMIDVNIRGVLHPRHRSGPAPLQAAAIRAVCESILDRRAQRVIRQPPCTARPNLRFGQSPRDCGRNRRIFG